MANGTGARPGGETHACLIDMAPTILYLLGLPVPDDMDGRVIEEIIDPAVLAANPITMLDTTGSTSTTGGGLTDDEEEELRARLEGLGYL
jgi:hypothetical protein